MPRLHCVFTVWSTNICLLQPFKCFQLTVAKITIRLNQTLFPLCTGNIQTRQDDSFDLFHLGFCSVVLNLSNDGTILMEKQQRKNILAGSLKGEYNCCCSVLKSLLKCHSARSDWLSSPPAICPLSILSLSFRALGGLFTSLE